MKRALALFAQLDDPSPSFLSPFRLEVPWSLLHPSPTPTIARYLSDASFLRPLFDRAPQCADWEALAVLASRHNCTLDLHFDQGSWLPRNWPEGFDQNWGRSTVTLDRKWSEPLSRLRDLHRGAGALLHLRIRLGTSEIVDALEGLDDAIRGLDPLVLTLVPNDPEAIAPLRSACEDRPGPAWWRTPGTPSPPPLRDEASAQLHRLLRGIAREGAGICPFPEVMLRFDAHSGVRPCPRKEGPRWPAEPQPLEAGVTEIRAAFRRGTPPVECRGCPLRARVEGALMLPAR